MKKQNGKQRLFEVVARLDKTFKPKLNEVFDNSQFPKDITLEQTIEIAKKVAEIISKMGNGVATVNMKTIEPASFDLDLNDVEYDGGSYNINDNGDVVNMALPDKPIVYNWKNGLNEYGGFGGAPEWEDPSNPDRGHDRYIYKKYVQNKEPRVITLKYPAVCKETGRRMKPGEQALYYPQDKSFFCLDSKQAQEWREMKADDQMGGVYESFGDEDAVDNQPKTEEQEFEDLVETYINGNITFFAHGVKGMEVGELVRFLKWAQENNIKF